VHSSFIWVPRMKEQRRAGRLLTLGIPVRAAMVTKYHTLSHGNTIRDAANLLLSTSQQDFPVVHGDQVVGLLGRTSLLRGMASEGQDSYVAGFMDSRIFERRAGSRSLRNSSFTGKVWVLARW